MRESSAVHRPVDPTLTAECGKLQAVATVLELIVPAPTTLEALEAQVLGLSRADRSRLLDRLVASLGVDAQAEVEWEQLAELREAEVRSERIAAVPLAEAMARLRARFPG